MSTRTDSANQSVASNFGYNPALDGLRAIAVTGVMLYHFGVGWLGGGFLGVDVFFVLSGFLITSLLLAEHARNGRIKLSAFWARRARRLLPALLMVLTAVAIAGHFLLQSFDISLLRTDSLAALFYVANWRMIWRGTGYFAATATPSPLQHTWSLGIEEQFYVLWPLIVVGLLAVFAARRTRKVLIGLCAAGAAASAIACAALYHGPDDVNRAYYGTDTRAQALVIGAALAALLSLRGVRPAQRGTHRSRHKIHWMLGLLAFVGAEVIAFLFHFASGTSPFLYRGGFALIALAVAAVIAHAVVSPDSLTAIALSVAPMVWLGRISYGVYLWHWPIFEFVNGDTTELIGWQLLVVRLAVTLVISVASFYVVESPIRHGALTRRLPRRTPAPVTAGAMGATALVIVFALAPPSSALTNAAPPVVVTSVAPHPSASGVLDPMERPDRKPGSEPRVDFFGDSVSWTIGTYLPKHPGIETHVRAIEGCGIALLPDILELGTPHTNYPNCDKWPTRWQKGVTADDPDVSVILLNRWELMDRKLDGTYQHVGDPAYNAYLLGQLDKAVTIAGSRGAAVVLLTAAYTHRAEKPDGTLYPEDQPARVDAWNQLLQQEQAKRAKQVTILDLDKLVCPQGKFTWSLHGLQIRSDGLHFTPAGVQKVIAPWLLPQLAAIASGAGK
jgi:peptidoglycan/LPS O-acetylase OafA/YrhL